MKISFFLLLLSFSLPLFSQRSLEKQIHKIICGKQATVGVAIFYDGKILTTVNDKEQYPMMSTFKFPLALAVLHQLDRQGLSLDTALFITPTDLHPDTYSPLRDAHPEGNFHMSIRELLKYTIVLSDNNACDILIDYLGGPRVIQKYLHRLGIRQMRIVATEDRMHRSGNPYLNHTRPSAAARLLELFLQKALLSPKYQDFLEKTMIETSTGANKLKGLLPTGTIVGHKTGSSDRNSQGIKFGDNDMGFVYLPDGKHYTIAVFVMNSREDDSVNASLIARISRAVYDFYQP